LSLLTKYATLVLYCLLLVLIIGMYSVSNTNAQISSFIRQNIKDAPLDWIEAVNEKGSENGAPSTDIVEVTYSSNGKTLNSTIWLLFPFKEMPIAYSTLNYGMLIDSDFNENTGQRGIDYQLEIKWNNQTKTWTNILTEWASAVSGRILSKTDNFRSFYGEHSSFVLLPLDLENIQYPNKFRIIYYAESKKDAGPLLTDFTKWINIPPPELQVTTYPQSIELKQGESKTVELTINSTTGLGPDIMLSSKYQHTDPVLDFSTKKLKIPSDGSASIPLTVTTSSNTSIAPHTIPIFTNSRYPELEFVKMNAASHDFEFPLKIQGEDRVAITSLLIDVKEPLSLPDKVSEFWTKLGEPLTFLYGILAGFSPIIFKIIQRKLKSESKKSMRYNFVANGLVEN
jgi:hypothetical protein